MPEEPFILSVTGHDPASSFFYRCRKGLENILLKSDHISQNEEIYKRIDAACAAVIMESVERVLFSDTADAAFEAGMTAGVVKAVVGAK